MATPTLAANSPVPTKVRNYDSSVGPTLITAVRQAAHGTITHATARTNVTTAVGTIVTGSLPAPTKWSAFTSAVDQVINASEAAPNKEERLKLLKTATAYLEKLLAEITKEEQATQKARGYFALNSAVLDYRYMIGVLEEAMANNTVVTFEAS